MKKNHDKPMKEKSKAKLKNSRKRVWKPGNRKNQEKGFECLHCHNYVSVETLISGVQNRNHCPYCLWSRHVDSRVAGDRLSACKAQMRPVGLTLKRVHKKYNQEAQGELMLIHQCVVCSKVSINRIAADDDTQTVIEIFESSFALDPLQKTQFELEGIKALESGDLSVVQAQLFGRSSLNITGDPKT
jgi:hypothetical protein